MMFITNDFGEFRFNFFWRNIKYAFENRNFNFVEKRDEILNGPRTRVYLFFLKWKPGPCGNNSQHNYILFIRFLRAFTSSEEKGGRHGRFQGRGDQYVWIMWWWEKGWVLSQYCDNVTMGAWSRWQKLYNKWKIPSQSLSRERQVTKYTYHYAI